MRLTLWGTRGSIAAAGPETARYGGDTSTVEIVTDNDRRFILDAGTGIRPLGEKLVGIDRVDILLSHLHMDHVQGLPFFTPLLDPDSEVHVWGPISTTMTLRDRLSRYLSPPLFPINVRDLPNAHFHDVPPGRLELDPLEITADLISHPGTTLGYRLTAGDGRTIAYLPDHEPALGSPQLDEPPWTSGFELAEAADILIHDAQYTDEEYESRIGWGHTSMSDLVKFAALARVSRLVSFHHDPGHSDEYLDEMHDQLASELGEVELVAGTAGLSLEV